MTERSRGVTLAEALAALALSALVMSGLAAFLASGFRAVTRLGGALAAQRALRWAASCLEDDVREAGFYVPCRPAPEGPALEARRVPPARNPLDPGGAGRVRSDELEIRKDVVLPARARLLESIGAEDPPPACRRLRLSADRRVRLEAGDLILAEDGNWEAWRVQAGARLAPSGPAEVLAAPLRPGPSLAHDAGVGLALVRPDRIITYRLAPRGGPPALLRQERGDPEARIVAEGISGFQVEAGDGAEPLRITLQARGRGLDAPRTLVVVAAPRTPREAP